MLVMLLMLLFQAFMTVSKTLGTVWIGEFPSEFPGVEKGFPFIPPGFPLFMLGRLNKHAAAISQGSLRAQGGYANVRGLFAASPLARNLAFGRKFDDLFTIVIENISTTRGCSTKGHRRWTICYRSIWSSRSVSWWRLCVSTVRCNKAGLRTCRFRGVRRYGTLRIVEGIPQ